ncbi:uncharacterized protein LTHEOB_8013 [Lasiodiplodia theobromae]|uniref:uncharacterized protein n=1 Tax=Lasiodiplodia theobromae TaxID=45133 RepID=UPI0015C2DBA3|nr:uncharacterized protein LTHEOB_8013 [Lasiodiplodia theobromae]KAF4541859.1 hypothetical protein LTHEOB_8013 [Lasiodiplodia theobromae]
MTTSDAEPDHDNTPPAGALTTVFTMPASCSTLTENYADFDCMPPSFSKSYWYGYAGYYSPAICPGNYTSACERPKSASGGTPFGPPIAEGENAIICCPTGYECLTGSESWCMSTEPTTSVWTYTYYESYSDTPITSKTTDVSIPSGYAIQVRWREQDLVSLETDPLTPGASATPPPASTSRHSTALSSALPTTSTPANTTTDGGGMSTSSKVGVGVGVPLGILAIAGLLFTFCFLRRRRRHPSLDRSSDSGKDLPEVHYTSLPHNKGGPMVGVNTVSSLPSMAGSGAGVYNSYNNNNYNHPEHHPSASGSIVMSPSSTIVGPRASSFSSPQPAATAQYSPAPMAQPEYIPPKPGGGSVPMMMMNHAYNNSTSHLSSPSITSPPAAIVGGSGSGAAFAPAPASASSPPPLAMFASLSSLHSHDYSNDSRSIHEAPGSNGWQQQGGGHHHNSFHHDYLPGVPPSLDGAGHLDVPGISSSLRSDDDDSATIATPPSYPPAAGSGAAAFAPRGGFGGGGSSSEAGDRVSSEHGGGSSSNSGKGGLAPPHGDDTDEIVRLRREAQRLQERRQRLTEMQQLDEEEERVMGRLRELEGRRVVY